MVTDQLTCAYPIQLYYAACLFILYLLSSTHFSFKTDNYFRNYVFGTVNSEIFAAILFPQIALKDIFETLQIRD